MAGAGYKLFNTGDVLTAAQVNTYLMEQTVMVFADAAARTTALSGVVSEGMISYLKDTNAVEVYDGSNWVSSDDPNAIQNTIVDAKGDLITATAADTPARLAVGSNGDTLVANSAESTGLAWAGNYAAGKNKIINGDFAINQRGFTSTTSSGYGFDRFDFTTAGDGTTTHSAQTFTPGSAPVAGYEATNFARLVTTGQTSATVVSILRQYIENVRTLAGQTATISFWAKAASGTPNIAVEVNQNFGSGGSPSAGVNTYVGQVTLSTSWARYSISVSVPSISGKTIGTTANSSSFGLNLWVSAGSNFNARTGSLGIQTNTFDIWGVQVEAGSVATAFQTATGTLQGEIALCQRYYQRINGSEGGVYSLIAPGLTRTNQVFGNWVLPVKMRTTPSSIDFSTIGYINSSGSGIAMTTATLDTALCGPSGIVFYGTATGVAGGTFGQVVIYNSSSGYFGISAEL
jgi:hypothetical protein